MRLYSQKIKTSKIEDYEENEKNQQVGHFVRLKYLLDQSFELNSENSCPIRCFLYKYWLQIKIYHLIFHIKTISFVFIPTQVTQILYFYWQWIQPEPNYPIMVEERRQIPQQPFEELEIKNQKQSQTNSILKTPKTTKINKRTSKKNRKSKRGKRKDTNFSGKSQKENRNYTFIVCKLFLLHVTNHPHLEKILKSIFQQHGIFMAKENFPNTFESLIDANKSYIQKQLVESVCTSKICNEQFSLIFRVLFRRFLKLQIFPTVFKSSQLSRKVKVKQAKFARKAYETFFGSSKSDDIDKKSPIQEISKIVLQKMPTCLKIQNIQ